MFVAANAEAFRGVIWLMQSGSAARETRKGAGYSKCHFTLCNDLAQTNKNLYCLEQVKVSMKRQVLGAWVKVPCIKDFGSCTYEDLCNYGYEEDTTCPASFVENHVPCRCPVPQGLYNIPSDLRISEAGTRLGVFVKGKYHATVHVVRNQSELACYIASFTIKTI
ncbi:hypothetical protein Cfor_06510 [Coptotermes formosanus]|uniref:MD-2-related lipid-recognition domain-containing protein n=1 Tax=Coptotermes formosanus TaxID=36987 RepID=A0A6L2QBM2_COPFO|nr:hypothetical protein Cfor_06510 [Coptotermes formosanus]